MLRSFTRAALCALAFLSAAAPLRAEVSELRISRQPGLVYLAMIVMEQERLIEKRAAEAGLGAIRMNWVTFTSGGASVDALLSGNVDFVTSGASNMLLLWDKTKGEVQGIASAAALPMVLVTRDPNVKTLGDFSGADRIAVPTVKISMQAVTLQIAADRMLGEGARARLDALTVQLGHPDALAALSNEKSEVNSHFSIPPYLSQELALPGAHAVLSSNDVYGGSVSNGVIFGTRAFVRANPKLMAAFHAALRDAMEIISKDPLRAANSYLAATKEKVSAEFLVKEITAPGAVYSVAPSYTLAVAEHLARIGVIKTKPARWQDYFFEALHGEKGS